MKTKLYIFLFPVLLFGFQVFAQEKQEHKPKTYRAEDGKFYVQKNLPLYLFLSNSAQSPPGEMNLLRSESTPQVGNPLYLAHEGLNIIRTPWAVDAQSRNLVLPRRYVKFEVYADSKAPETELLFKKAPIFRSRTEIFAGKGLEIDLSVKDQTAGVENTFLSLNGKAFQPFAQAKKIETQGEFELKFYSVDNVGNAEKIQHQRFVSDLTPPQTRHQLMGEDVYENIVSASGHLKLLATDELSGVENSFYTIDQAPTRRFSRNIPVGKLANGLHTISYYSIDKVENREKQQEFEFFVDKKPPIVVGEVLGNFFVVNGKSFSSGLSKFKITAIDNRAGVKAIYYSINKGEYQPYEKPFYLPRTRGTLAINFYAIDYVNNKGSSSNESSRTQATYMDLTGPELNHSFRGETFKARDTLFISPETQIVLSANDSESGLQSINYRIDQKEEKQYDKPFSIAEGGYHYIDFVGYDNVENLNRSDFFVVVDSQAPEIKLIFSTSPVGQETENGQTIPVYPDYVMLFVAATDARTGTREIAYRLNQSRPKPFESVISNFQKGRRYVVEVIAKDLLGNTQTREFVFQTSK